MKANRVGHSRYVFRLTKSGVARSGDDLQPLKTIAMGSFDHDLQLVNLAMLLERKTGGRFTSERRVRQDRCLTGVGMRGHVPDGLLDADSQKPIAIELELTTKAWRRLQTIMSDYAADLDLCEVWYFAGTESLQRRLKRAAHDYPFIKVFSWISEMPGGRDGSITELTTAPRS